MRDVTLDRKEGRMYMDAFLIGRKTDQYNQGGGKRLMEVCGNLCPVKALIQWMEVCDWDPNSKENLFPYAIRRDITDLMEIVASGNEINPNMIGPHSLRSGGGAMFVVRYDTDVIKKMG